MPDNHYSGYKLKIECGRYVKYTCKWTYYAPT